jgi:putative transposase
MMQKRMHSREFKLDVVRQIASGQKRPAQVCREYGLAQSLLSRWRKGYQERGEAAFLPQQSGESKMREYLEKKRAWDRNYYCFTVPSPRPFAKGI